MIHISIVIVFQKHVQTRRNREFGCGDHNYQFYFFFNRKTGERVELTSQASSGTLHVPNVHRVSVAFILRAPE